MTMPHHTKPLLIGVDDAGRSDDALSAAADLAHRFDAAIEVVHAIEATGMQGVPLHVVDAAEEAILAKARGSLGDVWPRQDRGENLIVRVAHPARLLVERAKATAADILFVGPHERRGLVDFGGTTRALLAHAPCDLWVQPGSWEPPNRVLVPIDLSPGSMLALGRGRELARAFDAELVVLHAWIPPTFAYSAEAVEWEAATDPDLIRAAHEFDQEAFERALAEVDWGDVPHSTRWLEGRPAETILSEDAGLVVLGTHGRSAWAAALLGSVAYEVLRSSNVGVLAVRQRPAESQVQ